MSKKKKDKKGSNNPYALTESEQIALDTLNTDKLKTIVGQYSKRDDLLTSHVKQLQDLVKLINDENLKGTKQMEEEIKEKEDEVVRVQKQIFSQQNEYGTKILRFDEDKDREFRQYMIDRAREVGDIKKKIEQLTQEKNFLLAFPSVKYNNDKKQREVEYMETIAQLEHDQVEAKKNHAEELQKYERNFIKQKRKIDEDQKEAIQKIRREALEEANKKIRDAEQTTKENIKLNQDLELHKNELQQLQIEREQITHQNNQYKRSLAQNHEGLTEYQTVNHKQSVKIKKLKEKVIYLQEFLEKENKKFEEEIEVLQKTHKKCVAEMEYEIKCFNEQIRKRSKEIRDIKDQRSDIEQFFLEALDQVKEEQHIKLITNNNNNINGQRNSLQNESQQLQSYSSSSKIKLPTLSKTHKHSLIYKNKIDISQLDEEDKEKILRMVFQKMNSGIPPKSWRQYYDYNTMNDDNVQERDEENDHNDSQQQQYQDRQYRYDDQQIQSQHNDSHLQQEQFDQYNYNNNQYNQS